MSNISFYVFPGLQRTGRKDAESCLNAICNFYGEEHKNIVGSNRRWQYVRVRHALCFTLHRLMGHSLHDIAYLLGRNHTTILHAHRAFLDLLADETRLKEYRLFLDSFDMNLLVKFDEMYKPEVKRLKTIPDEPKRVLPDNFGEKVFLGEIKRR